MIDNIPVTLNFDHQRLVGKGRIEDGKLTIEVSVEHLVREIENLAINDDIRSLSLGVEYIPAVPLRS